MKIIFQLILIITMLPSTTLAGKEDACIKLDRLGNVGKTIWKDAHSIRGIHYCDSRASYYHDIDFDGDDDLFVTYSVEGPCYEDKNWPPGVCGNYDELRLAVFILEGKTYKKSDIIHIGGRGENYVENITFDNNNIIVNTLEYSGGDPQCCPSHKGKTVYQFNNGKISKVEP